MCVGNTPPPPPEENPKSSHLQNLTQSCLFFWRCWWGRVFVCTLVLLPPSRKHTDFSSPGKSQTDIMHTMHIKKDILCFGRQEYRFVCIWDLLTCMCTLRGEKSIPIMYPGYTLTFYPLWASEWNGEKQVLLRCLSSFQKQLSRSSVLHWSCHRIFKCNPPGLYFQY